MSTRRTILAVCRAEFSRRVDSIRLLTITLIITVLLAGQAVFIHIQSRSTGDIVELSQYFIAFEGLFRYTLPFIAIAFSYKTVATERETGRIRVLLSVPYDRTGVIIGKYLGCVTVCFLPTVVSIVVATGLTIYFAGIEPILVVTVTVLTLWFVAIFVAVSVFCSARFDDGYRALVDGLIAIGGMLVVWPALLSIASIISNGNQFASILPFIRILVPTSAYSNLVTIMATPDVVQKPVASALLSLATLTVWTVCPLVLAVWSFNKTDL